jgi:hypothetical protein
MRDAHAPEPLPQPLPLATISQGVGAVFGRRMGEQAAFFCATVAVGLAVGAGLLPMFIAFASPEERHLWLVDVAVICFAVSPIAAAVRYRLRRVYVADDDPLAKREVQRIFQRRRRWIACLKWCCYSTAMCAVVSFALYIALNVGRA